MEPRKHYFAKIPTIAIFIVMAMSGPLGVLLFILKGIDQKMQKEEQEAARAGVTTAPPQIPHPCLKRRLSPGRMFPRQSRKVQSSGIKILPPSAPLWALCFCLPA